MNNIKHFSFDLWSTLIKLNPTFKKERDLYFYKKFNSLNKSIDEVASIIRNVNYMCNSINEKTGYNIDSEEIYLMIIYQLNNSHTLFENIDIKSVYEEIESLVFKYTPILISPHTHSFLRRIKENPENTLNILSNTTFIKGKSIRTFIDHLELSHFFNFQIYSDEVGVSKPNPIIYNILLANIEINRGDRVISKKEIIHIGDNPVADIMGAKSFGINAFQINSNGKLLTNLFD